MFQEVALARKVWFYCGNHMLGFENLVGATDFTRVPYSKLDALALHWKSYLDGHTAAIRCLRQRGQGEDTTLGHMALLFMATMLDASRPEDKIHGMYGCAKRLGLDWPTPDYTKSVAQIYIEATIACFRQSKDLAVMSMAIGPSMGELEIPSWVPDFSGRITAFSPSKPPSVGITTLRETRYSGSTQCEWTLMRDGRQLKVHGERLDYVVAVGESWQVDAATTLLGDADSNSGQIIGSLLNCIDSWFEVALQRTTSYKSNTDVADELIAVSDLARLLVSGRAAIKEPPDRFAEYLSILIGCAKGENTASRTSLIHPDDNISAYVRNDEIKLSQPMVRAYEYILPFIWKLVFRTGKGSYMGIGNHNVMPGDLLVVLHGMASPCLVRPCEGGFNFVGAAFVEGIMDCELWDGRSKTASESFILV